MSKRIIVLFCCIFLGFALLPAPYGYYQFLRVAICAACIWTGIAHYKENGNLTIVPAIVAILYNPVFIIHFTRPTWQILNVMSIILLCFYAVVPHRRDA